MSFHMQTPSVPPRGADAQVRPLFYMHKNLPAANIFPLFCDYISEGNFTKGGMPMEDSKILALYRQRSERALEETEKKYGALLRRIAKNLLDAPEDAEECVNDALHAAWQKIPPEQPRNLSAWLGRVTRNLAVSRFRKNRAQKRSGGIEVLLSELDDCVPAPGSVAEAVEAAELSRILSAWLDSLAEADCILFVRRYWYGDAVQALAKQHGCTPAQMAQRMLRLRNNLKTHLEAKGVSL